MDNELILSIQENILKILENEAIKVSDELNELRIRGKMVNELEIFQKHTEVELLHNGELKAHIYFKYIMNFNPTPQPTTVLQLSATMTLIRFVNGLLDPSQQSQFAIPLNLLAKKIGLPSWFVELRHAGTHEGLPSLEMLEIGVLGALDWLKVNYWEKIKSEEEVEEEEEEDVDDEDWKDVLRKYRRIRRVDINKFIKFGDSSEEGKEYWKVVKVLESGVLKNEFYKVLMFKKCIINENQESFVLKILDKLMFKVYEDENKLVSVDEEEVYNGKEIQQVKSWCLWILEKINNNEDNIIGKMVEVLSKTNQSFSIEMLERLKLKNVEVDKINLKINTIQSNLKEKNNITPSKRKEDDDLDIFQDLENLKKRVKLNKSTNLPIKIFEPHSNWIPKPFGVL
ncbi:unnamed protein product [Wickerhamomyces anomalus]